jgi:hypothetical protein
MTQDDPRLAAAYRRLAATQADLEHREFMQNARAESMRVNALVETQRELDDAGDRREDAVREARQLGMDWRTIAQALQMTEVEARERFGSIDGLIEPDPPDGPTHYEW